MNHPEQLSRRPVVNLKKAVNKDPTILDGTQMQGPTPSQKASLGMCLPQKGSLISWVINVIIQFLLAFWLSMAC